MSNVTVANFTSNLNDAREGIWKLSRAMKAAGWVTLASSDGYTKDTSGIYINDKWNGVAGTGNSGAGATVASVSGAQVTLTGLSGFASGTAGQHWIALSGATNAGNDGYFKILTYISATSVTIFNPAAVAGDTVSWTEYIPLSDTYNTGIGNIGAGAWIDMQGPSTLKIPITTLPSTGATVVNNFGNNQTGSTASYLGPSGSSYNYLPIISGLSNMTYASVGRLLTISGGGTGSNNGTFVIVGLLSSTSVVVSNFSPDYSDSNNGSLTWTEGGTTSFIRGENVTQTTSGATGELLGTNFDFTKGTGYLVIQPRNYGSGVGKLGWDSSDNITGSISGATVAAGGTPIEFVREIVFWTGNPTAFTNFTGYMQTLDGYTENAFRFSTLAGSAGATATIAPGGGGTGNVFPGFTAGTVETAGSYVFCGTASSKADGRIFLTNWTGNLTNAQIMCADATYYSGKSADGSFILAIGTATNAGSYLGYAYMRVDNGEEGDVDPYVFYAPSADLAYVPTRTTMTTAYTAAGEQFSINGTLAGNTNLSYNNIFRGWRRRGFGDTLDAFQNFVPAFLAVGSLNTTGGGGGSGVAVFQENAGDPEHVATAQDTYNTGTASAVLTSEPLWVISTQAGQKMYKGTCRWLRMITSTTTLDTLGSKSWLQLCLGNTTTQIALMGGPWDGSTTPTH